MEKWNYENLDNDIEELNRNLLKLNNQSIEKASKSMKNLKVEKSEKRLRKTVSSLLKGKI